VTAATRPLRLERVARAGTVRRVRYLALAALPIAALLAVLLVAGVAPSDTRWPIIDTMIRASKVVGLFGCLMGALSFRRSEHLFRAWSLIAAMYGLLVLRDAVIHRSLLIGFHTPAARWLDAALVMPANLLAVLGAWMMGRAWYVGGIALPGTRATRSIVHAAAVAMSLAITMPAFWFHAPHLLDGTPTPLMGASTALADALSLSMLAPVLLTALALRGGAIVWPWALLTCSMFGWLCYDVTFSLSANLTSGGEAFRALSESFRALAAVAAGMAGIAQWLVATATARRA
jgi:hypothetical protein